MNPVKPNPNFFPPNQEELNPDNSNAHNRFLSKNQTWIQTQTLFFRHKYSALSLDQNEIAQQILIVLRQALLSYDPTKGTPFRTFADTLNDNQAQTAQPSTKAMLTKKSENSWNSNQSRQYTTSPVKTKLSEKPYRSGSPTKTTTKPEKKCWKTQKKFIFSRTKPLLFAINRYGLVAFFGFGEDR